MKGVANDTIMTSVELTSVVVSVETRVQGKIGEQSLGPVSKSSSRWND